MPRFEAQLLLSLALGVSRTSILTGLHPLPTPEQLSRFQHLVDARVNRQPLAYLRGSQEFYGLEFEVDGNVLIPRPETEMLVEFSLEHIRTRSAPEDPGFVFADIGTGSGCIALSILAHAPATHAVATDISFLALAVARRNAVRCGVTERLRLLRTDLLTPIRKNSLDLVVSNPPYIPRPDLSHLQPEVRDWEPRLALDGGPDGYDLYLRLVLAAQRALRPGGWLVVEVGQGQATTLESLFETSGFIAMEVRKDLAGIDRLVAGRRPV